MSNITIGEHIDNLTAEFRRLARSTQKAHARKARAFIAENPGCADNSNYWRGLSARQVISAAQPAEGNDAWDREIAADAAAGRLDHLAAEIKLS